MLPSPPQFDIPLARPSITDAELAAVDRALRSGQLVSGEENSRFEHAFADACGRRYGVAVSSGTAALELAFWALAISRGDCVGVTAFGFHAAANVLTRMGAQPIPIDVDDDTWTMDLACAERLCSQYRCKAVVSTDQLGVVAEAEALQDFAQTHDITVINDAACGLGGSDSAGLPAGKAGVLATLSFHPRKTITTSEGGGLACDDPELASRLKVLRNHGRDDRGYTVVGTNARLSEAAAAMGMVQLRRMDEMLAEKRLLAQGYRDRLAKARCRGRLRWQEPPKGSVSCHQSFAVLLADNIDRAKVVDALASERIQAGPATFAFHMLPPFRDRAVRAPVARALHERSLSLPFYVGMRSSQLDLVSETLERVLA